MQQHQNHTARFPFLKKTVRYFLMALTLLCIYAAVIEWLFQQKKSAQKITVAYWSHRGRNNAGFPENSIPAFEHVIKQGLKGIEADVFWDDVTKQMLVTHDAPQPSQTYPLLKDIVARFKDSISYWIDFKNLTNENVKAVEEAVLQLVTTYKLQDKLFLESGKGMVLRKINSPGIHTLYWIQYGRNFPVRPLKLLYIKSLIVFSNFYGYTGGYSLMDEDFRKQFEGLPLFIFHANAQQLEQEKGMPSSIKVQLVDEDYLKLLKQ